MKVSPSEERQLNRDWRPGSELPPDDKPVLALCQNGEYDIASYGRLGWASHFGHGDVDCWTPLHVSQ